VFASSLDVVGVLAFNERDVAVIQARTAGFVERVYAHAPGDMIKANAAIGGYPCTGVGCGSGGVSRT
jgi:membrane fusion protein, copper/silver efflux system